MRLPNPPVIAVIEDDGAMREALSELMEVLSFACQTYEHAEAFLLDFTPDRFHCVVTDLHLPGISGLDLQQRLRALGAEIPVIIVTSSIDTAYQARAAQQGTFAYLTKPVSDKVLIQHVTAALDHVDRQRERGAGEQK